MPTIETLRELADLAAEIARLPDDANVGWATAALLINVEEPPSQRTLERWRQARNKLGENGPPYIPGPGLTSPVSYNVGAVRAWVRERQASTTMDVSVRRGLTFATIADLGRPEPWVMQDAYIVGHALTVPASKLERALRGEAGAAVRVAALSDVMLGATWSDPSTCRIFYVAYTDVLRGAQEAAEGVLGATDLHEGMSAAVSLETPDCPKCGRPAAPGHPCRL